MTPPRAADSGPSLPLRDRLLALLLRPTPPRPLWGVLTAVSFIAAETVVVHVLKRIAPDNAFGAVFLLGVLVVSAGWGFRLAVATSLGSTLAYVWFHVNEGSGSLIPAVVVFLTLALLTNVLVGQARLRAAEATQRRFEADLAAELARLMLRTADLDAALTAAGNRVAEVIGIPFAELELDVLASDSRRTAIPLHDGDGPAGTLLVPANLPGPEMSRVRRLVPSLQALLAAACEREQISAELQASRARIVTAADQARRRFERDLHDGAQQRIVSLGLELRALEASAPDDPPELREQLTAIIDGLAHLHTDLQELSRGIHPAILSRGGLGPAIKTLARRSAVPVALDVDVDRRLPESVEVAAYYVVAEALTNAAKHAQAEEVTVWARVSDAGLTLRIADDGIGGAGAGGGSGLLGLKDRVEALSGRLGIDSEAGAGTAISVVIPLRTGG